MKKASIAVALVLVFGLFAAAFSLTPAIAQYGTGPSSTPSAGTPTTDNSTSAAGGNATTAGNTTTAGNATTSSNATSTNATSTNATGTNTTSTQGSTFSAKGSIATLIFDTGTTVTNNTNETGTSSANATSTSNATSSNMTSLGNTTAGNMTSGGNTTGNTTLSQTIVGGDNATGAGNATGGNMTSGGNTTTSSNMTSLGNTTAGNATTSTSGNATSNATSTAALEQPYVLSGDWSLDVQGGTVSDFKANFTMVHIDGTMRHTHEVSNFKSANGSTVQLEQNGTTIIFGTADVSKDGSPKWTGVDAVITIDKLNVASISFASEDTDDHFHGQPIYGVVDSLTDENGNEMVQAAGGTTTSGNATGGNMTSGGNATSNATQSGQSALNQTGNAINNATQGVQDFLNGTG